MPRGLYGSPKERCRNRDRFNSRLAAEQRKTFQLEEEQLQGGQRPAQRTPPTLCAEPIPSAPIIKYLTQCHQIAEPLLCITQIHSHLSAPPPPPPPPPPPTPPAGTIAATPPTAHIASPTKSITTGSTAFTPNNKLLS